MGKEILVPISIVAIIATMLIPLPETILNFLLVSNFTLAVLLLMSSLYITEPLKLSVLPTLLLLTTLYRLSLNIATTRMILSTGSAGEVVAAFGKVVVQGNIVVGFVVFLIITLVQFLVVAKGAERVAEVSARFTLDALPGKQMSIDADVRAGLIDSETASRKRDELQSESRFYGSLDGAMKFVKGDSIAGLIVTAINIVGGLLIGLLVQDLDFGSALHKYTLLTIGDGLLSQIPALLNATAAGIIVTRVSLNDGGTLANDLLTQLTSQKKVQFITAIIGLTIACLPGLPALPFVILSAILIMGAIVPKKVDETKVEPLVFNPKFVPVLEIRFNKDAVQKVLLENTLNTELEVMRQRIYDQIGILIQKPYAKVEETQIEPFLVYVRGVLVKQEYSSKEISVKNITSTSERVITNQPVEFIDDIMTRKLLDTFDLEAPELISSVVPGVITVTQLSSILKSLVREGITIRHFDIILQAIAEFGPKAANERILLEEVRIALKRVVSDRFSNNENLIEAYALDPFLDLALVRAEREDKGADAEQIKVIVEKIKTFSLNKNQVVITSRGSRRLVRECLEIRGIKVPVLAYEELTEGCALNILGHIELPAHDEERVMMELAA